MIKAAIRTPYFRQSILEQLDEIIAITKTEAKKDQRYALLLKLMHETDEKSVLAGGVVTSRHADPRQWFTIQMNSLSKIDLAKATTGERRANAVKDAFRDTVEYVYTPYIKTLVYLTYLREGRDEESLKKVEGMHFGNAVNISAQNLRIIRNCSTTELRGCATALHTNTCRTILKQTLLYLGTAIATRSRFIQTIFWL